MMLELPIKATTVAQVPPGNLIRVSEIGKPILGILVPASTATFLLAFEPSVNSPKPNMLVPLDPNEPAMDYGPDFRFDFGCDSNSISVDCSRFHNDAGTLVLTGGATLMVTRFASTNQTRYVEIASGQFREEPSWGSCVLIGGWTLAWWPSLSADPWPIMKWEAPVVSR